MTWILFAVLQPRDIVIDNAEVLTPTFRTNDAEADEILLEWTTLGVARDHCRSSAKATIRSEQQLQAIMRAWSSSGPITFGELEQLLSGELAPWSEQ